MILEFTIGNYRSIADRQTLSLVAAALPGEGAEVALATWGDAQVLPVAAIWGANASGKSNVWRALREFCRLAARSSVAFQEGDELPLEPFLFRAGSEKAPTYFEMVFRCDKRTIRYGFEATSRRIESEWLFAQTSSRETRLFTRERNKIEVNARAFREGVDLVKKNLTRDNALFLSVAAQWNGAQSRKLVRFFENVNCVSGLKSEGLAAYTARCLHDGKHKHEKAVVALLRKLDLSLDEVRVQEVEEAQMSLFEESEETEAGAAKPKAGEKRVRVEMMHPIYDENGQIVGERALNLLRQGSEGTLKLFSFAGPLVDTLARGSVLCVDELDARLHPLATRAIIGLFNSPETNPCRAQLIFNTHDTNLLSRKLLRRDQAWFAEKDRFGATHLYSLAEFRQQDGQLARKDANFEEHYIQGRYGAIPFLGDFSELISPELAVCEPSKSGDDALEESAVSDTKPARKKSVLKKVAADG